MFYQLKEIWAIREQINRSPIIKILVYYPFPLSPEAGYSVSKGSVDKVEPWRQKLSVVVAVSVALGSRLAPLVGEKHWNRAEYRFKKKLLLKKLHTLVILSL